MNIGSTLFEKLIIIGKQVSKKNIKTMFIGLIFKFRNI